MEKKLLDLQQTPNPPQIHELPFSLLPYPQMIMEAIEALKECSKTAIVKHIESSLTHLPPSHLTLLNYHLNLMKQSGQIVFVRNNYMKPDTLKSEPQEDESHVAVTSHSLRPRGRPSKSKEVPPRRQRGRPPKTVKGDDGAKNEGNNGVVRRGRGRPPKVKLLSELTD
ncbi:unnamed protein product [Eruca vesicaria subsp. sativa]|uniref:H15 domain-containing protein n=1 Tax=Eruca vesicaria subsp. sativa TaxID=29727 RepID=A0ABC8JUV6_ERUVS|nr:unnamed protein product [Eruca vesicaria subsp. sativa]